MGILNFLGDVKVLFNAATTKTPTDDDIGSIPTLAQQNAKRIPKSIALICDDQKIDWQTLNERANRVAHTLAADGVGRGDCVSLFMQNRIEFVTTLLGINKLGAVAGLINTNLTKKQLTHCISLIDSKKCIFGSELVEPLREIKDSLDLNDGSDYYLVPDLAPNAEPTELPNWAKTLDDKQDDIDTNNPLSATQLKMGDVALYIFTSGTTGLPKAAIVSNKRILQTCSMSSASLMRINQDDCMYNCLPLYHGTGLMVGLSAAFHAGASTVIRRRLSVSAFWDDIRKHNCTCFVYIGEFVRYLMSSPPSKNDAINPIRAIVGNGLRPDIWRPFKERFDIERIGEFYGASEGNGGFANVLNKDATVGLGVAPVKLAQYNIEDDEIVRDASGNCIEVAAGESGLLLIQVTQKSKFEGYTSDDASQKKVVTDAFKAGDMYFNSGDLMKTVDVGFAFGQKHYQFVDRVGDTFRWKSENVSTNEVGELINTFSDIVFTNVYGVEVPGSDGKAGMAAVVLKEGVDIKTLDIKGLSKHIISNLPNYARPIFIRVLKDLPTTTTHKLQKNDLRGNAYHLDKVQDDLLVLKPKSDCYVKLDSDYYDQIVQRAINF